MEILNLRQQQLKGTVDAITSLRSIVVNISDTCNRTCNFCVKSIYAGDSNKMDLSLVRKIRDDLISIDFNGRIGINGFGEPFTHEKLIDIVKILSDVPCKWLEIQTNGDFLSKDILYELETAGCTTISISMYDHDKTEYFKNLFSNTAIELILRHNYDEKNNYGLHLINRIDMFLKEDILNIDRPCYYPFYKFFIDHDGSVRLCNNDVKKVTNMGNLFNNTIKDIWLGKEFTEYRKKLFGNDRSLSPCNKCNINGELLGAENIHVYKTMI